MHRHSNRIHPVFALFFSTIILLAATADAQTFFPASQRLISISPPSLEGETALDYDNDGWLDLVLTTDSALNDLSFGLTVGDIDGDGDLDLFQSVLSNDE